jgi:transposase
MKSIYEQAYSFQAHQKTRKELADEKYARRLERDLKRAEAKALETAARVQRKADRRAAAKAKRIGLRQQRTQREARRLEKAKVKVAAVTKRETVRAIKATPKPRKPSLKQLNRLALQQRLERKAARKARLVAFPAPAALPPLPYRLAAPKLPPLPY